MSSVLLWISLRSKSNLLAVLLGLFVDDRLPIDHYDAALLLRQELVFCIRRNARQMEDARTADGNPELFSGNLDG